MPLSIGVVVGTRIRIQDKKVHRLVVKDTAKPNLIVVSLDGGPPVVVSDQASTEILPKVFVFSGVSQSALHTGHPTSNGTHRLAFEAPKEIKIRKLEKYET